MALAINSRNIKFSVARIQISLPYYLHYIDPARIQITERGNQTVHLLTNIILLGLQITAELYTLLKPERNILSIFDDTL